MKDLWITPRAAVLAEPDPGWAETLAASLLPGSHAFILTQEPTMSIEGRRAGFELRDTILVCRPGATSFVFLFRLPLSESTVAGQVMATGTGGLNVDASRIASAEPNPSIVRRAISRKSGTAPIPGLPAAQAQARGRIERRGSAEVFMEYRPSEALGRWPPNVLLVHGSRCRSAPLRGEDGLAVWQCQDGCPVKLLDDQAGNRPSTLTGRADPSQVHENPGDNHGTSLFGAGNSKVYADSGGASRYYPQFANDDEMMAWLQRLLEGP